MLRWLLSWWFSYFNKYRPLCIPKKSYVSFMWQFFPLAYKYGKFRRITGTEEREKRKDTPKHFYCSCQPHSIRNLSWGSSVRPKCHMSYFICQFLLAGLDDTVLHLFSHQYLSCQICLTVSHVDVKHAELLWVTVWHSLQPILLIILLVALRTFTLLHAHRSYTEEPGSLRLR